MPHTHPKLPLTFRRSPPISNTPDPRPTPLTTRNGIQIQSAVLPQYTFRRDRDRYTGHWRQVCTNSRSRLTLSDAANNSKCKLNSSRVGMQSAFPGPRIVFRPVSAVLSCPDNRESSKGVSRHLRNHSSKPREIYGACCRWSTNASLLRDAL